MGVKLHFLDVGDGDCTIIDFPGRIVTSTKEEYPPRVMMVDIHHHEDHDFYEHVIDYYKRNFTDDNGYIRPIFRYVSTHPHKDHIKGMKTLFDEINIVNFWDIDHNFVPEKSGTDWEEYKDDWEHYEKIREGKVPNLTVLNYTDKVSPRQFWDQDGIEVLSPSKELYDFVHKKEDGTLRTPEEIGGQLNNLSYVLLINFNGKKIILAGDAENKCWEYILANHRDKIKDIDILKAPHHGRESAFHEEAVKYMNPKHIIFSSSAECEHTVPEKYQKAAPNATMYNTCDYGSFILDCDFDGKITFS
jgi:beta-lactamase superfamily II metal-dependent hydrolase